MTEKIIMNPSYNSLLHALSHLILQNNTMNYKHYTFVLFVLMVMMIM